MHSTQSNQNIIESPSMSELKQDLILGQETIHFISVYLESYRNAPRPSLSPDKYGKMMERVFAMIYSEDDNVGNAEFLAVLEEGRYEFLSKDKTTLVMIIKFSNVQSATKDLIAYLSSNPKYKVPSGMESYETESLDMDMKIWSCKSPQDYIELFDFVESVELPPKQSTQYQNIFMQLSLVKQILRYSVGVIGQDQNRGTGFLTNKERAISPNRPKEQRVKTINLTTRVPAIFLPDFC